MNLSRYPVLKTEQATTESFGVDHNDVRVIFSAAAIMILTGV